MEEDYELATIVVDSGTSCVRAGFTSSKGPRSIVPNVASRCLDAGADQTEYFYCDKALSKRGNYSREYPMEKGVIINWDVMEKIWNYVLGEEMRADPTDYALIFTDATFSPKSQRTKMGEIIFETFGSPFLRIIDQSVAALGFSYADIGLVVDVGYESARVVPVYHGHAIAHHGVELNYGGKDLTEYMGRVFPTLTHLPTLEDLKERKCVVAYEYEAALEKEKKGENPVVSYELPDSQVLTLGNEAFKCPEILFSPSIIGKADMGLHKAVFDVLMKFEPELRSEFLKKIFLCGGVAATPGIADRLQKELSSLLPENDQTFNVTAPPGTRLAPYYGASFLEDQCGSNKKRYWSSFISKDDYDENGSKIVQRMYF